MPKHQYKVSDKSGSDKGQAVISFVVNSTFGMGGPHEVNLILLNKATNNNFYEKHVLRLDDDPEEVLGMRQALTAISIDKVGAALDRFGVVNDNKNTIVMKNAPASTMLRLDKIDLKLALYHIAEAFLSQMYEDNFGDYSTSDTSGNFDLSVTFPAQCVEQRDRQGGVEMGNTMSVGGARKSRAVGDPARVSFDVNHCNGV